MIASSGRDLVRIAALAAIGQAAGAAVRDGFIDATAIARHPTRRDRSQSCGQQLRRVSRVARLVVESFEEVVVCECGSWRSWSHSWRSLRCRNAEVAAAAAVAATAQGEATVRRSV